MGALHGRSTVERKVRFKPDKEGLIDPQKFWIVWVALQMNSEGPYFSGVGACEIFLSNGEKRIKLGYKSMPEHVNSLDKAIKGKFLIDHMDLVSKNLLINYLEQYNIEFFRRSPQELTEARNT